MKITIALLAVTALAAALAPAQAQYYPPPGGYYPQPSYPQPGYPPPGYAPPEQRVRFGRHCDATMNTGYGPQRLYCPIVEAKPIGMECACPPPRGYPPGPYFPGVTVR